MTEESDEETKQDVERLKEEVSKLIDDIDHSYYRIPKEEFESITVSKITKDVSDQLHGRISTWRNWIGITIVVLSFFGINQIPKLITEVKEDIKKEVEENMDDYIKKSIQPLEDRLSYKLDTLNEQYKALHRAQENIFPKVISTVQETAKTATNKEFENIKSQLLSLQKSALEIEVEKILKNIKAKKISYSTAAKQFKSLVNRALETKDKHFFPKFLDSYVKVLVNAERWLEVHKLQTEFEKDFNFSYYTWVNIAIADMSLYEKSHSPLYKERAVYAYHQALNLLPDYGTPYAVRLILHMIDYNRSNNNNVKENEKAAALKLINNINAGRDVITSYETYNYLNRMKSDRYLKEFILSLEGLFPNEMIIMKSRYQQELDYINKKNKKPKAKQKIPS
ncbi:hypothetical protein [Spartinivicinus poritis]|uniref:Uncharacterized protein n=1 Tax=Spartinivicinus poritis TaxID=2994640 RepID=A0ABT5U474_9GAMM|nr:hypothetical protein [Spartinivicinus sp. A2-2]MDE1461167.1 hypothetical protein [Spartinivicinus sp. A2-2]